VKEDASLVNAYSNDGFTGLVFFRHTKTAHMLAAARAEVNRPSRNQMRVSPLHSAVASRNLEILDLLHGNPDTLNRLLAAGADPRLKTNEGKTPADPGRAIQPCRARPGTYSSLRIEPSEPEYTLAWDLLNRSANDSGFLAGTAHVS
jgi:hypothetical protein